MKTGKPELMRELNKSVILETVRKEGPISRARLSKKLDLSFPAISSSVNSLLEKGWIVETEKDNNQIGRKATLLEYNGKKGYVIGIDIGRTHIALLLSDITGKTLVEKTLRDFGHTGEEIIEAVIRLIHQSLSECELPGTLMCISVGIPGYYQEDSHSIILAPFVQGWEDIDLKEILQKEFKVDVLIDNSVNLGAIAEKWQGNRKGCRHLLYMDFGIGIGSALILDGELYRGFNGVAGEIGYHIPDYSYSREEFNTEGVFEKIFRNAVDGKMDGSYSMKSIFEKAKEGEPKAVEMLDYIKRNTEIMLCNCVSLLNPEYVIFAGNLGRALFERYGESFKEYLKRHVPYTPIIEASVLGERASVDGAVAVALRNVHSGYSLERM